MVIFSDSTADAALKRVPVLLDEYMSMTEYHCSIASDIIIPPYCLTLQFFLDKLKYSGTGKGAPMKNNQLLTTRTLRDNHQVVR